MLFTSKFHIQKIRKLSLAVTEGLGLGYTNFFPDDTKKKNAILVLEQNGRFQISELPGGELGRGNTSRVKKQTFLL